MPRGVPNVVKRRKLKAEILANQVYTTNPLKQARIDLGLSQVKLAELCRVSPGAILKYEQGLYQEPSIKIMRVLQAVGEEQDTTVDLQKLTENYYNWRELHRAAQRWLFEDIRIFKCNSEEHPFKTLRRTVGRSYTVQGFAVLLAIHPATIHDYDSGKLRSMPNLIREALETAGCRESIIADINKYGEEHYDLKKAND